MGGILVLFIYNIYIYVYIYIYIYVTRLASNEIFSPSNKIHREVGRAKDVSAPLYNKIRIIKLQFVVITNYYMYRHRSLLEQRNTSPTCQTGLVCWTVFFVLIDLLKVAPLCRNMQQKILAVNLII
jgi:hypothetical protein